MACRERGLLTTILLAGPESRRAEAIYENFSVCRAQSSRDADGGFSTRRNCRLFEAFAYCRPIERNFNPGKYYTAVELLILYTSISDEGVLLFWGGLYPARLV